MNDNNKLYFGDNLDVLKRYIADETVDLIYLDPPFNSNANYNVLFKERDGAEAASQIQAFEDTWKWDANAARAYQETVEAGGKLSQALQAFRNLVGESDMLAYLSMMAPRLQELRRVLKPTGSIYLHCDPTASHYLKLLMDAVFGSVFFQNEVIWKRTTAHSDSGKWGRVHDTILFFTKSEKFDWNKIYTEYDERQMARFKHEDSDGRVWYDDNLTAKGLSGGGYTYEYRGKTSLWRVPLETMKRLEAENRLYITNKGGIRQKRYLDELSGRPIQDVVTDIWPINSQAAERLGYPTQKPLILLERILQASSNEGDLVLDPFCGCGTTIDAAQKLGRRWIGIDITHLAINLIRHRLKDTYGEDIKNTYDVIGEPTSVPDARVLAEQAPYQFQWWALGLVGARPAEGKKGADKGIDGRLFFHDVPGGPTKQIVFSVKAGKTNVAHVRDLCHVVDREKAQMGVLISMHPNTQPMRAEAAGMGTYESPWGKHPKIQLLTVSELLDGKRVDMPLAKGVNVTFKQAQKYHINGDTQLHLSELAEEYE